LIQDLKFKSLFIISKAGYISVYAMRMLASQNISLSFRNLNGDVIYDCIPHFAEVSPNIKLQQYKAYSEKRSLIAKEIIKAKQTNYNRLLTDYNYQTIDENLPEEQFSRKYFKAFKSIVNRYGYQYENRRGKFGVLNLGATNQLNSLLNFYYGLIEHRLIVDISRQGLDYQISYLHVPQTRKLSLAYDLIEYLRADIDRVVLGLAETGKIKETDFTVNTDYYMLKQDKIAKYLKPIAKVENMTSGVVEQFIANYITV
ncbi:MAG: CRISPR-associated endonuclease Cas1, partial [Candidatus Parvarchaeum sp.]